MPRKDSNNYLSPTSKVTNSDLAFMLCVSKMREHGESVEDCMKIYRGLQRLREDANQPPLGEIRKSSKVYI